MTYSADFRWRAVSLLHVYGLEIEYISDVLGPRPRTIKRWYQLFLDKGVVHEDAPRARTARWPPAVLAEVKHYVKAHPTFYLEELQDHLLQRFPLLHNVSLSTICRALHFDLNLSRKVLTRAARECVPQEVSLCGRSALPSIICCLNAYGHVNERLGSQLQEQVASHLLLP